ncbi:MAG: [Eubacterium sp.]|nr:[FeFe] hydrogenase H-cluster radical SAM maturase HydE [Eubacterium sp.]
MYKELIDMLESTNELSFSEYLTLIKNRAVIADYAAQRAAEVRNRIYGNRVFIRGLIEISSYCKNDCLYCGLRCSNKNAERYRLTKEQILSCADEGYALGFRTFVLQGGEDGYFTDELLTDIISEIKRRYPDTAVTLSLGERSYESYKTLKQAGADRYLLRHETADNAHYARLHPNGMSFENRQECIKNLKKLGYQVGVGFMVGSPYQTEENLANELLYLKEIQRIFPESVRSSVSISRAF